MPLHLQPVLRARQVAMESEGLIQKRDSTLITIQTAKETQGLVKKVVPLITHILRGNKYVASGFALFAIGVKLTIDLLSKA